MSVHSNVSSHTCTHPCSRKRPELKVSVFMLPLTCSATLSKSLCLSGLQFLHLSMRGWGAMIPKDAAIRAPNLLGYSDWYLGKHMTQVEPMSVHAGTLMETIVQKHLTSC